MNPLQNDILQLASRIRTLLAEFEKRKELSGKHREPFLEIIKEVNLLLSLIDTTAEEKQAETLPPPVQINSLPIILIVDNNADVQEHLHESLSDSYSVFHIKQAGEALNRVKEINPDIIISDILLPDMRGDVMCRQLKSSIETSHIPIIFLTVLDDKESIITGLESGADDYITKPFDIAVLKARIRNILQNRDKLRKTILASGTDFEGVGYTNTLDKAFLDKAVKVIESELSNPEFSINELCRAIGMSRTSVYNKMKNLTDQGPNDFIRIIRLKKAYELLKSRKHTVIEVSVMVGFSDSKYFSTSFKKQFGESPSKIK